MGSSPVAVTYTRKEICKKGVLKYFEKLTRKHLCRSLFFNKLASLKVFSCEFCEISENTFFIEQLQWLPLHNHKDDRWNTVRFFLNNAVLDVKAYFLVSILWMALTILAFPIGFIVTTVLDKRDAFWNFNLRKQPFTVVPQNKCS